MDAVRNRYVIGMFHSPKAYLNWISGGKFGELGNQSRRRMPEWTRESESEEIAKPRDNFLNVDAVIMRWMVDESLPARIYHFASLGFGFAFSLWYIVFSWKKAAANILLFPILCSFIQRA